MEIQELRDQIAGDLRDIVQKNSPSIVDDLYLQLRIKMFQAVDIMVRQKAAELGLTGRIEVLDHGFTGLIGDDDEDGDVLPDLEGDPSILIIWHKQPNDPDYDSEDDFEILDSYTLDDLIDYLGDGDYED